jgi:hypothetical protein
LLTGLGPKARLVAWRAAVNAARRLHRQPVRKVGLAGAPEIGFDAERDLGRRSGDRRSAIAVLCVIAEAIGPLRD